MVVASNNYTHTNLLIFWGFVVGRLYSIQYKSIFVAPGKVRGDRCEEAWPLWLDFQRCKVKIHHLIVGTTEGTE